ncbi:SSS family solute:Na+ symporter [Lysobacter sp. OAE881]|uniref:sodium:solute symporter family transporter n=1 Tax=Lysobacter sp. OAE881 TaxID=2663813 RepID=UPI001789660A
MAPVDFWVLAAYLAGTLALGFVYAGRNRRTRDMFAAGRKSPWWVSGLSSFMTLKSAGTFVVWGGLAYREGVVAIAINTCIGVSGLLVGTFVAGRWRRTGVTTPAEFVELRFGPGAVQLYTWAMLGIRLVWGGVALYAVSVIFAAVVPLEPGHVLRDPATGHLSVAFVAMLFGAVVLTYTAAGGLWAVLMTDVLQFIVLQVSVLFLIALLWMQVRSGVPLAAVPASFLSPTSAQYTSWFLAGWVAVHFFLVGAEWAFAQRYICVPTVRDARWSAWLFGALYLVSPALWLLPTLLFRWLDDSVDPEQAFILASQRVLPAGMLGLMVAAMFSATASSLSAHINVFAGVLTEQFYGRFLRPFADERERIRAGRMFAVAIGLALIGMATVVPHIGGAEQIVLTVTGLLLGPLMAPTVWGLWNGRIGTRAVFATVLGSFAAGMFVRFAMAEGAAFADWPMARWAQANPRVADVLVGAVLPVVMLAIAQATSREESPRWHRVQERFADYRPTSPDEAGAIEGGSAKLVAIALAGSGVVMLGLFLHHGGTHPSLAAFAAVLLIIAAATWFVATRTPRAPTQAMENGS